MTSEQSKLKDNDENLYNLNLVKNMCKWSKRRKQRENNNAAKGMI